MFDAQAICFSCRVKRIAQADQCLHAGFVISTQSARSLPRRLLARDLQAQVDKRLLLIVGALSELAARRGEEGQ